MQNNFQHAAVSPPLNQFCNILSVRTISSGHRLPLDKTTTESLDPKNFSRLSSSDSQQWDFTHLLLPSHHIKKPRAWTHGLLDRKNRPTTREKVFSQFWLLGTRVSGAVKVTGGHWGRLGNLPTSTTLPLYHTFTSPAFEISKIPQKK